MADTQEIPPTHLIARKRDGLILTRNEIRDFISGVTSGRWTDAQVGAMLMAIFLKDLDREELSALTEAMIESGDRLELTDVPPPRIDKHSTGGVGDKVSLIFAPMMASLGIRVPMLSGRALGHTGGTLDKLEAIPGLNITLSPDQFRHVLRETGMAIAGTDPNLVPADRRLYALRDVTATVGHLPLIASSIMSKKLAVTADGLVLDVKTGSGAFTREKESALALCRTMVKMGHAAGRPVVGFITRMDQPLGTRVGNALEVDESLAALRGEGPDDLMAVTLALGTAAMAMAGLGTDDNQRKRRLQATLESGRALEMFSRWVAVQGGDTRCCEDPARLPRSPLHKDLTASRTGFVTQLDAREIGLAAHAAGAGRNRPGEEVDPGAGLILHRKVGDPVQAGDVMARVYASQSGRLETASRHFMRAAEIGDAPPAAEAVVLYRIDAEGVQTTGTLTSAGFPPG